MKRYSILGRPHGGNNDLELAQCDSNPAALLEGFKAKTLVVGDIKKRVLISRYTWLRIRDNEESAPRTDAV